jgi:serine protease Do
MSSRKSAVFYAVLIALVSVVVGMVIASRLDLAPRSFAGTLDVPKTNSAPLSGAIDATTFRTIAHDASPSVVSIIVTTTEKVQGMSDLFGFDLPFGNQRRGQQSQQPQERPVQGAGSGFIIDKAGYIMTNNHVVENANSIEVHLSTMGELDEGLPAKVIGRDPLSDTALIQLTQMPKDPLVPAKFGDSDQMAPGDWVMAIGNPFELSNTVTVGVVSAVGRNTQSSFSGRSEQMIQTDAAINRGNSGGPLLNIRGEVIGINTMILSESLSGGNIGVGFAVPINTVRDLLPQLREGKVVRGRIGVGVNPRPLSTQYAEDLGLPSTAGAEIVSVEQSGPAKDAGIRVGDVIVDFNGKPVKNSDDLVNMVTHTAPGTTVPVKVIRDKKPVSLNVKVAELDLSQEAQQEADNSGGNDNNPRRQQPKDTGFGMTIQEMTPSDRSELGVPAGRGGAVVTDVTPFSAAADAGIQEGDVILSVQGTAVHGLDDVSHALDTIEAGHTGRIIVWRQGQQPGQGAERLLQIRKR